MPVLTNSYIVILWVFFRNEVDLKDINGWSADLLGQISKDDANTSLNTYIVNAEEQIIPNSVIDCQAISGADNQPPDFDGVKWLLLGVDRKCKYAQQERCHEKIADK